MYSINDVFDQLTMLEYVQYFSLQFKEKRGRLLSG